MPTPEPDVPSPLPPHGEPDAALFAQRLRRLIDVIYPAAQGRPYTDIEIGRHTGLSNQYVGKLRKGLSVPSLVNAGRLARLFGVSTDYFLNPPDHPAVRSVERNLRMIETHRAGRPQQVAHRAAGGAADTGHAGLLDDEEVRQIAEGAAELPPAMRGPVRAVIEQLRKAIGLGGGDEAVRG
ncbi:helix-turn-helix domain-containing protein [Streptomyces sp. NPDC059788]|uniref:helix-turn-helix domain-containing protein n=1 Tax=Streptomyces sp. NPDC059788 TaxID=3346948 RepID=UPI00364CD209